MQGPARFTGSGLGGTAAGAAVPVLLFAPRMFSAVVANEDEDEDVEEVGRVAGEGDAVEDGADAGAEARAGADDDGAAPGFCSGVTGVRRSDRAYLRASAASPSPEAEPDGSGTRPRPSPASETEVFLLAWVLTGAASLRCFLAGSPPPGPSPDIPSLLKPCLNPRAARRSVAEGGDGHPYCIFSRCDR